MNFDVKLLTAMTRSDCWWGYCTKLSKVEMDRICMLVLPKILVIYNSCCRMSSFSSGCRIYRVLTTFS